MQNLYYNLYSKYLPVKYFSYIIIDAHRTIFSVTNNKYNKQSCRRITFSKTLTITLRTYPKKREWKIKFTIYVLY